MFPQGGPGIGLLLLRTAAAGMFAMNLTQRFNFTSNALYWLTIALTILISLSLLLGFLTTIFTIVACIAVIANLFFVEQTTNAMHVLNTFTLAALFFLGPGAYSIDARLFGLRVTVVPPRKDKSLN